MKKRGAPDDDEIWRVAEIILQAIAMGLCALILLNMSIESRAGLPTHVCIDSQPSVPE